MDFFSIHKIWTLRLFLMMTSFYGKSNSLDLFSLRVICSHYFPFETVNNTIRYIYPPDNLCTAVSTFGEKSEFPPPRNLVIKKFKRDLPYVYVMDYYSLKQFISYVLPANIEWFIYEIDGLIMRYQIDVFVIDFFDDSSEKEYNFNLEFQTNLKLLYEKLSKNYPHMLFGLKLHRGAHIVKSALKSDIIDPPIHFYVVNSYNYIPCVYKNTQKEMLRTTPPTYLLSSIRSLNHTGYKIEKMILTLKIAIKTLVNEADRGSTWSNSWSCGAQAVPDRRFCRTDLAVLYNQAKLVHDNHLPGVVIEAVDCDDYDNICHCGNTFPALRVISHGINGKFSSNLEACKTFGLLPGEKPEY